MNTEGLVLLAAWTSWGALLVLLFAIVIRSGRR
jgi:hypothetical protein